MCSIHISIQRGLGAKMYFKSRVTCLCCYKARLLPLYAPTKQVKKQSFLAQGCLHVNFSATLHFRNSRQQLALLYVYCQFNFSCQLKNSVAEKCWDYRDAEKAALAGEEPVSLGLYSSSVTNSQTTGNTLPDRQTERDQIKQRPFCLVSFTQLKWSNFKNCLFPFGVALPEYWNDWFYCC